MSSSPILITGATGKQGSGVTRALASLPLPPPIFAVTRNPESEGALKLKALSPSITLLKGDFAQPKSIVDALPSTVQAGTWKLYLVGLSEGNEVPQTKAIIDAAIARGVKHVVYSSVHHSGEPLAQKVAHWESKVVLEAYLKEKCGTAVTWTIIQPVFLLDNLSLPGLFGTMSVLLWSDWFEARGPLQVVDPSDIGVVAARALAVPESKWFEANSEVPLCGDELTFAQADKIFKEKTGHGMEKANKIVSKLILLMARDFGRMVTAVSKEGFGASVSDNEVDGEFKLSSFGDWVSRSRFIEKQ
jgi:uncharacterized protein YbjT (DUF2867 family)